MRLRLIPQKRGVFVLYNRAAANAVQMARLLTDMLARFPDSAAELAAQIKEHESEGDVLTHEMVDLANRTFVTPFDRDDMYRLAGVIDDICDFIDETAEKIGLYGVKVIPPEAQEQADVILRAAVKLEEAVQGLDGFRDVRRQLIELRELEDEGDRLVRRAVAGLFRSGQDPISIIRWKDIHDLLEEAVDACENASDVLEAILVKNR